MKKLTIAGVILLTCLITICTVSAVAENYVPTSLPMGDGMGGLYVTVLCHNNIFSNEFFIQRSGEDWHWAASRYLNSRGEFYERFAPGNFELMLLNGNGGRPEYVTVRIDEGYTSYATFIGHAASGIHCEDVAHTEYRYRDYIPAGYQEVCHGEVNHTVYHDEVNHTVEHPAETHEIFHPEVNHTFYHPEVNHTITVIDQDAYDEWVVDESGYMYVYDYTGHCKQTSGFYDFMIGAIKYRIYTGHGDPSGYTIRYLRTGYWWNYVYTLVPDDYWVDEIGHYEHYDAITHEEIIVDVEAYTEIIVDQEAYTEIVTDEEAYIEIVIDSPAYEEIIVDVEAYCEQVLITEGYFTDWSTWSREQPEQAEGREIESIGITTNLCGSQLR